MDLGRQLLDLIIGAIPTAVIVFFFYLFARSVFFNPVTKVLAERAERTEGARAKAAKLEAVVAEKLSDYQRALDKAKAEIYAAQETARHRAMEERARLLQASRQRAFERVKAGKERLAGEMGGARLEIERQSVRLAEDAVQRVLARVEPAREDTRTP